MYDNQNSVCGICYNSQNYFFLKNLQGDVIAITNSDGEIIARYSYDAWGVCTMTPDNPVNPVATINPFRYRGYYYDTEIGMYYLQSRYYDPATGRFINADSPEYASVTGNNLFAYCGNEPVMNVDRLGNCFLPVGWEITDTKVGVNGFIGFGFQVEIGITSFLVVGMEFIWYTIASIRQGRNKFSPFTYSYGGTGYSSNITNIVAQIIKDPSLLFNPLNLRGSVSVSIFAVFGINKKFKTYSNYTGFFGGFSTTIDHIKGYTAWSDTCIVAGVGLSTDAFSVSGVITYYLYTESIVDNISSLYNYVLDKAKTISKPN